MISAAAFCPHPPALIPEIAGLGAVELEPVRAACASACAQLYHPDRKIVLLGAALKSEIFTAKDIGTMADFGVPIRVAVGGDLAATEAELPPSLTVGAWLASQYLPPDLSRIAIGVGPDFSNSAAEIELARLCSAHEVALLILGDGSACRSERAPGFFDPDALSFDVTIAESLASGDPALLAALDPELGAKLLASGVPVWLAAADVLALPREATAGVSVHYSAKTLFTGAPLGVEYPVAIWLADE